MDQPVTGLQTSIWNNNLKSMALLAAYPFILGFVLFAGLAAYGYFTQSAVRFDHGAVASTWSASIDQAWFLTEQYWPIILTIVIIWFMIAYFFQGSMIRAMSHSHPVTRKEEPLLYNLVENMCISVGMKMPRIEIIESHARNAFASGINDATYCVTVTRGLMQSLEKDELEAVLAHELTHILNRDVRLMIVCIIFTGMLGVAAQLIWSNVRYMLWVPRSRDGKSGGNGVLLLFVILAIVWIGYLATVFTRFAISRRREYMADAGAVQLTKNPDAMMRALLRISGAADLPKAPGDLKAMCFENAVPFLGLFATHPPIASRIQAISNYSGLPTPNLKPKISAEAPFDRPTEPGQRDNWTTRQRFANRRNKNPWISKA
jgi:heat shock protein HtpX